MRRLILCLCLSFLIYTLAIAKETEEAGEKGDQLKCAVCVILLGLLGQGELESFENNLPSYFCQAFQPNLRPICEELSPLLDSESELRKRYNGLVIENEKRAPEDTCWLLGMCESRQCKLWSADKYSSSKSSKSTSSSFSQSLLPQTQQQLTLAKALADGQKTSKDSPSKREWKWSNILEHLPVRDDDNDYHSPFNTLRGADWRGKDCDDLNSEIYPGRSSSSYDPSVDHNCNGIFGTNSFGQSYEELFCGNSSQRGVMVLGDSISAHFHIPVPSRANLTIDDLLLMASNEVDYPQCSWATGHSSSFKDCSEVSSLPLTSFYLRLLARNRCNHRDFQNISRNGARSPSMAGDIVITASRRAEFDSPMLVFYAMIANDVCNGRNGTGSMTPPDQFRTNTLKTLNYLNTILPIGSTVVLVGHIHGDLMWDSMYDNVHFIGVTYGALWDFLACLEETACWGWLNGDAYWREQTSLWAESLNQVMRDIAAQDKFSNFDVVYIDNPDREYHRDYAAAGGDLFDLYEVMDGGHPSVTGEILMGEYVYNLIEQLYPNILGPINPNNNEIQRIFGDQGGY